jgi:hypothetical protein
MQQRRRLRHRAAQAIAFDVQELQRNEIRQRGRQRPVEAVAVDVELDEIVEPGWR